MGSDVLTLFPGSQTLLGKRVDEMVGDDLLVSESGSVVGTFKYVTDFTEFNVSNTLEQEGYYFPFKLTQTGTKMTIKKNGIAGEGKENMDFDPEIILRVSKNDEFEILVDDVSVINFNFSNAIFQRGI